MSLTPPSGDHAPDASPFAGHTVVFTGKLASLGRRDARSLVERLGGVAHDEFTAHTTMLVVGEEGFSRGGVRSGLDAEEGEEKSAKLRKAEHANARQPGSVRIVSEDEFCELGGLRPASSLKRHYHSARQVRDLYPAVREDRLRYLEQWGVIRSEVRTNADRYYSFRDVAIIRQVNEEIEQGRMFRAVLRSLVAAREGQMELDFGLGKSDAPLAKVLALRQRAEPKTDVGLIWPSIDDAQASLAARYFQEGADLDEGSEADRERAATAYRKALLLDPTLVPALVNLANIHYAHDQLIEALALYERALNLDAECFEASFNLGNIHHDLGRYEEAVDYYRNALRLNAAYADAHFYLAVTLEKLGQSRDAKGHWRAYQQLAPDGEWAELAREFSE